MFQLTGFFCYLERQLFMKFLGRVLGTVPRGALGVLVHFALSIPTVGCLQAFAVGFPNRVLPCTWEIRGSQGIALLAAFRCGKRPEYVYRGIHSMPFCDFYCYTLEIQNTGDFHCCDGRLLRLLVRKGMVVDLQLLSCLPNGQSG